MIQYKGYDVEVTVSADEPGSMFETTYTIYHGRRLVFTGLVPLDVTSTEDGERVGYAAARLWIDQQR